MLHGTVLVNNNAIGTWTARRIDPLDHHREEYDYICTVMWTDPLTMAVKSEHGVITHRYDDGAFALMTKVAQLAEGGWDA